MTTERSEAERFVGTEDDIEFVEPDTAKRGVIEPKGTESAMAGTTPTVKAFDRRSEKVRKAAGISMDDLRQKVNAAVDEAFPPQPAGPGEPCGSYSYVSDLYDDYAVFSRDGDLWKIGYSYANGIVTLTGEPVPVVRAYVDAPGTPPAQETTMATKTAKDAEGGPGAAADEGGAGDGGPINDGGDIILLANDRLSELCDALNAGGGVLTPEIRQGADGICALLETITESPAGADDDGADEDEDGLAGGPGQPEPMSAAEKTAKRAAVRKRFADANAFVRKVAKAVSRLRLEKDAKKKATMKAAIDKAITFGAEAFGSETGFMSANLGENIPEFTDPAKVKQTEETAPAPQEPAGQFAQDKPGYTPGDNSQQAFEAGSPEIAEKLSKVRKRLVALRGAAAPPPAAVAKSEGAHAAWGPAYLATLPDSAFLHVEKGALQDAAGRSNLLQGPSSGFRHFAVRDIHGALSGPQIRKALSEIPNAGLEPTAKAALTAQAQTLLKQIEGIEAQAVSKASRGKTEDDWPDDMNAVHVMKGEAPPAPSFGHDNIAGKVKKITDSGGTVPLRR